MSTDHLLGDEAPDRWASMSMDRHMQNAVFARMAEVYGWAPIRSYREERLAWASEVLGFDVESFRSLTNDDASELLAQMRVDELALEHQF
jgi:hypothetical protein